MTSLINALPGALSQGLIWGIMAIGLYLTYKVLDLSDLTVDGSFATGGAVCVTLLLAGCNVWLALLAALVTGMLTGWVTSFFHTKLGIPAILAGILTQLGLWSVNLGIMGKANLSVSIRNTKMLLSSNYLTMALDGREPIYMYPLLTVGLFVAVIVGILYWFFGTELGASIRATGANVNMARAQGINTDRNKVLGLMISNGLVALSGALLAQYQGFADVSMGKGAIVIGLAAIIIGEVVFGKLFKNFALKLTAVCLGAIIYYVIIQAVISLLDIDTNYMKLLSALIVAVFLAVPTLRQKVFKFHRKERHHA